MERQNIQVHKFGGYALANPERLRHAASLIKEASKDGRIVVIASAMQGVTSGLKNIVNNYSLIDKGGTSEGIFEIYRDHMTIARELFDEASPERRPLTLYFSRILNELNMLGNRGFGQTGDYDRFLRGGELYSPAILAALLREDGVSAFNINPMDCITTDGRFGNAQVDLKQTSIRARNWLCDYLKMGQVPVIGGFFGASPLNEVTLLGDGGSDLSAAALANALRARKAVFWKEYILHSKDPKGLSEASPLSFVDYDTAERMSRNGAKIFHPETINPLRLGNIPLYVKDFLNPENPGTLIHNGETQLGSV